MRFSTRLAAAMVILIIATTTVVGFYTYRVVETTLLPGEFRRIETDARQLALQLQSYVRSARTDASAFQSSGGLRAFVRAKVAGGFDPQGNIPEAQWHERFAARLKAELAAKPNYRTMRVIGLADGGQELIRVDRSGKNGAIRDVPSLERRPQAGHDFFRQAINLPLGQAFVSPISHSEYSSGAGEPAVPVLRIATAVPTQDGAPFGVFVVSVDLRGAFEEARAAATGNRRIYVVDASGGYVVHPDRSREFAFEGSQPVRWQDEFPELATALGTAATGAFLIRDAAGNRLGAAIATTQLADGPRVSVIETIPYAELMAPAITVGRAAVLAGAVAIIAAFALALLLARSLTRPLVQMTRAVEALAQDRSVAVPTGAGGEIGVLADAFERMRAEVHEKTAALKSEVEERRRIFETSPDLLLVMDRTGHLLRVSPASTTILDRAPDELVGHNTLEYVHPDDLERTRDELRSVRRGGLVSKLDCRVVHKDGRAILMSWTGVWSEPEQHYLFIGRDITERVRLDQQLRQAQKMDAIGQLTGGIAHDFNNLLTVIIGAVEALAEASAADPEMLELTKLIDTAATRGANLTRHLLAYARRQPLHPGTIDVNHLVENVEKLLSSALGEHIEIELILSSDTGLATVDPGQLTTTLLNLALNARDAMPGGGKLVIETSNVVLDEAYAAMNSEVEPGLYAMIAVSDTGQGIPADVLDKVFDPFFTTKEAGKGTGLGLSMVYGFVKQSGGHIKIYSEEGHGTTVKIYLPRAGRPAVAAEPAAPPIAAKGGGEMILVVEDDAMVRRNVLAQLQNIGYRVVAAERATEALDILERGEQVDLLFTDVVMPGALNGRQLANEVMRRWPAIGVLFTSGYTENAIVHHGRLDPGVLLLAKPYRWAELARMVRLALDARAKPRT